jgi:hypothetical protein
VQRNLDLMPDGKHILTLSEQLDKNGHLAAAEVDVVVNWFEEIKARFSGVQ